MISTPISEFYHFGRTYRYLRDIDSGTPIGKDDFVLDNLKRFFEGAKKLGLKVTTRSQPYFDLLQLNIPLQKKKDEMLSESESDKLRKTMREIEIVLDAEIWGFNAFIVSPKRIEVEKLLKNVPNLFSPNVFNKLPLIAKKDLEEAGKCIAFELPTAAAFHTLRATESVLRGFYLELAHRNRIKTLMWGNIINDLRNRRKAKPFVELLNHLDHIRNAFRNPTQHPEMVYDINEVQDLWSLCVDAINRMSKIL